MNMFHSEMHVITFVICIIEFSMLCLQLVQYLSRPKEEGRLLYVVLLGLLLFYNITGGLFPDERLSIPIVVQNIVAYGSGFLVGSYLPYYFYRAFCLKSLKFHALYGVPLFFLLPYVVCFLVIYPQTQNIEFATSYGMIVPFLYSLIILYAVLKAIKAKIKMRQQSDYPYSKVEMFLAYAAVSPWVFLTIFSYLHSSQWLEVLVTNSGFLIITVILITKSVRQARIEQEKLLFYKQAPNEQIFEANLLKYSFTYRETEIIRLIRKGKSYQEVADLLFIASTTVSRHIQNIHSKADVKSRLNLMRKLEMP